MKILALGGEAMPCRGLLIVTLGSYYPNLIAEIQSIRNDAAPIRVGINLDGNYKTSSTQIISSYHQVARAGAGEVQLLEGYFVHFTAPENLAPIPKHVVFVLDTSGSMRHRKMHQTIAAMVSRVSSLSLLLSL